MQLIKRLKEEVGVSLLEVLIALIITGIVTTALFKAYLTQHENYIIQDDISEVQQSARAAIDELSRHIRMAGNQLPIGIDAIEPTDKDPDIITVSYSSDGCAVTLSEKLAGASADMKCTGDVSCFSPGQWAFIIHPDSGGGEFFQISQVQTATSGLAHSTDPLSTIYDEDAVVVSLDRITFFVDNTTDPDHPNLMIYYPGLAGAAVFAENISDLQLQYRLKNGVIVDQPVVADDIREVLISVTGRSKNPDYEDTDEPYRHRTYSSSVNVRNLGS